MNLSIFNNRTTAAALERNGQTCLALIAGGTYRLEAQKWRGTTVLRSISAPAVSVKLAGLPSAMPVAASAVSFCSNFGGSPSIGTPAIGAFRMHAAPLALDPSANQQQEGDA